MPTKLGLILTLVIILFAPFTSNAGRLSVAIIGTSHYSDVSHVRTGLADMKGIADLHVTQSTRGTTVLEGDYSGDKDDLMQRLDAISIDRFSIEERSTTESIDITLKKLQ